MLTQINTFSPQQVVCAPLQLSCPLPLSQWTAASNRTSDILLGTYSLFHPAHCSCQEGAFLEHQRLQITMPTATGEVQTGLDQQLSGKHQVGLSLPFSDLAHRLRVACWGSSLGEDAVCKVIVRNPQKLSGHHHALPLAPLFSPFTSLPKHHVFHSVSISLMLRMFCPFSSPQTTPPVKKFFYSLTPSLLPGPVKYPWPPL